MLVFTDRQQVYKTRCADFADAKASVLGDYLPTKLSMDEGEGVMCLVLPGDYSGQLLLFFENGKCARLPMESYATKTNRKRLTGAYSDKSPLRAVLPIAEERQIAVFSTEGRALVFNSALLAPKTSRTTMGVGVMTLKPRFRLERADYLENTAIVNLSRYRVRTVPAAGALLKEEDRGEKQMTLMEE
jgi:DNA gyrase subunit A